MVSRKVLWTFVVLFVVIGVIAAVARVVFPRDLATRFDPVRAQLLDALHIPDPFVPHRPAETARFDSRFATHPVMTLLHILPGALFLIFASLQFSNGIRNRHIRFHRWSGRILLITGVILGLS